MPPRPNHFHEMMKMVLEHINKNVCSSAGSKRVCGVRANSTEHVEQVGANPTDRPIALATSTIYTLNRSQTSISTKQEGDGYEGDTMYNDKIREILGDEDYKYTAKAHQIELLIKQAQWDVRHFMAEALMDRRINADDALKECERYILELETP